MTCRARGGDSRPVPWSRHVMEPEQYLSACEEQLVLLNTILTSRRNFLMMMALKGTGERLTSGNPEAKFFRPTPLLLKHTINSSRK